MMKRHCDICDTIITSSDKMFKITLQKYTEIRKVEEYNNERSRTVDRDIRSDLCEKCGEKIFKILEKSD